MNLSFSRSTNFFMLHSVSDHGQMLIQCRQLTSLIAEEDCAARRLLKDERPKDVKNGGGEENEADGMTDEQWKVEIDGDDDESEEDKVKHNSANMASQSTPGLSEYEKSKAKNIAELKLRLAELEATHPMPEEFVREPVSKKRGRKKKAQENGDPAQRRESTRNRPQQIER